MQGFLSKHTFKLDRKGRVSVPAPYRARLVALGFKSFLAVPSLTDPAVQCHSPDLLDRVQAQLDPLAAFKGGASDPVLAQLPEMTEINFDEEGRFVVPRDLIAIMGVAEEVVFAGRGLWFEIWDPKTFADHQQALLARLRENTNGGAK